MTQYEMKDELGRNLFIKLLGKKFVAIQRTSAECSHDINATGKTINGIWNDGQRYSVEIKIRKNTSTEYRSTILEQHKVKHFEEILRKEPHRTCYYAVFFSDGVMHLYDISKRIIEAREACYRWKFTPHKKNCRNNNTGNSYLIPKAVYDLEFNYGDYGDRKYNYEITENSSK